MSYSDHLDSRFEFLQTVIRSAGALVKAGFETRVNNTFSMKGPQDYLTETDAASEAHIRDALADAFPEDSFFGEEGGGVISQSVWVVDPVDGTANFARGVPHFCISIGYLRDGVPELAAIYNPVLDELYLARKGQGASLNGKPIGVSKTSDYRSASVEMGWSTRIPNARYLEVVTELLGIGCNVRRCGSGALALAHVADGRSDAYVELHMNSWDCVPGMLIVEEAGGVVCPYLELGDLENGGPVLVSTPGIAQGISTSAAIPVKAGHFKDIRDQVIA